MEDYYRTNMDFLNPEVSKYFLVESPAIYSKVDDYPATKYNPGSDVKNALVSSGCIINGHVENSLLFKNVYIGNGAKIINSILLNDVYIGDNVIIENCTVESRSTLEAGKNYISEPGDIKIVAEINGRYTI